jgi:hypothetical protein
MRFPEFFCNFLEISRNFLIFFGIFLENFWRFLEFFCFSGIFRNFFRDF